MSLDASGKTGERVFRSLEMLRRNTQRKTERERERMVVSLCEWGGWDGMGDLASRSCAHLSWSAIRPSMQTWLFVSPLVQFMTSCQASVLHLSFDGLNLSMSSSLTDPKVFA